MMQFKVIDRKKSMYLKTRPGCYQELPEHKQNIVRKVLAIACESI